MQCIHISNMIIYKYEVKIYVSILIILNYFINNVFVCCKICMKLLSESVEFISKSIKTDSESINFNEVQDHTSALQVTLYESASVGIHDFSISCQS